MIYSDESDEEEKVTGDDPTDHVVSPSSCINRLSIDINNYEKC